MAHSLILGMTESGKTTLAKRLIPLYRAAGVKCGVLDPLGDPSWGADFQTTDVDEFLRVFYKSRSCAFFVDEAGEAVGRYDDAMVRTATKGRHWGHMMHYCSQRGTQLNRTVRDQCGRLFLFTTALADAKIHAAEWNRPDLANAHQLRQGEYYSTTRFGELVKNKLF